jgi:hypothetical protein
MNKKKLYSVAFSMCILCLKTSLLAQNANTIYGKWKGKADNEMKIEFYNETDKTISGKATSNNTNGKIKMGNIIFKKLIYTIKCNCLKGTMQPHDANITADAKITFISNIEMKVSISKFIMRKTFYLIKII